MLLLLACTPPPTVVKAQPESSPGEDRGSESGEPEDSEESGGADSEPWSLPARPDTDHPGDNDAWRWGGGVGYPDVVDPTWPVVRRVSDLSGLSTALAESTAGAIVWVEEEAEIDLTGQSLCIPGGVWLASNRGSGKGGLLYATQGASDPILKACGEAVRVTGLRIRGPDPESCPVEWPDRCPEDVSGDPNCAYCTKTAYGLATFSYDGLEVDNNEFSGWTYAAVGVKGAVGVDMHHNHVHHGWREGLGYGLVIYGADPGSALIRWNRFNAMRHAVAGQGYPGEDYEARNNLVEEAANGHVFDMHGQDEALDDGSSYAGGDIRVHNNIVLVADQYSFVVRGKPDDGAWLYNNCLAPSSSSAYTQRYYFGNVYADVDPSGATATNHYGASAADCGTLRWCLADREGPVHYGSASGTPAEELLVGDLDGDGKDDVFGSTGTAWRYANPAGGSWSALATTSEGLSRIALVDLDGDGRDDVFRADGSSWSWSKSGTASWATLKSSAYTRSEVGFGDFDGDGAVDVFTTDGSRWSYHPKGSGAPVNLATSGVDIADLAFGDFDGDGITDVFYGSGSQWRWSRSGSSSWADLAVSSNTVRDLAFADVDGDGTTDVLGLSHESLRWSSGGRSSWVTLRHHHGDLSTIQLGDFDGDGAVELLTGGCL
jgi:hypothetical protein